MSVRFLSRKRTDYCTVQEEVGAEKEPNERHARRCGNSMARANLESMSAILIHLESPC